MNRKKKLLIVLMVVNVIGICHSQEPLEDDLGITLDVTYVSRYIWRGIDIHPKNHSAIQPSVDIDLYDTGFGLNVWWSRANGGGFENSEEIDYTLYYSNSLFKDESCATEYNVGWVYYHYPDEPRKVADTQEVYAGFCWPNICPVGLVPSYTIVATWPSESESNIRNNSGWLHILGLGYDVAVPGMLDETGEQILHFSATAVYNDGTYGKTVDHDWSHCVFGVSTGFEVCEDIAFTPGFYYQSSWDDSVNSSDEYWTSLSLTYTF